MIRSNLELLTRALFYQDKEGRGPRKTGFHSITAGILAEADEKKRVVRAQKLISAHRAVQDEDGASAMSNTGDEDESEAGDIQEDMSSDHAPSLGQQYKGKGVLRNEGMVQDAEAPQDGLGPDEGGMWSQDGQNESASNGSSVN